MKKTLETIIATTEAIKLKKFSSELLQSCVAPKFIPKGSRYGEGVRISPIKSMFSNDSKSIQKKVLARKKNCQNERKKQSNKTHRVAVPTKEASARGEGEKECL